MDQNPAQEPTTGTIVALSRDVFFGMRMRTTIRQLGYTIEFVKDEAPLLEKVAESDPTLVFVDFNQPVNWETLAPLLASDTPVVAFSSHTNVDGFRAAKAAGVNRTVSNGDFSRTMPDLIAKYGRSRAGS
ncbi:MAG TPA: hypothetical protein VNZ58_08855 [Thermomicrobiales bacterium]|nr:hypothetical protein [Thermomicrobiales bacterium]